MRARQGASHAVGGISTVTNQTRVLAGRKEVVEGDEVLFLSAESVFLQ